MPKLLGQFLQEPQEQFALEVYLLERGYHRGTTLNARSTSSSAKFLKSSGLKKRRHVVSSCSKFLKDLFSQFVLANNNQKIKNAAEDRFSSPNSANVFDSCKARDVGNTHFQEDLLEEEVDADRKLKWKAVEDSKQLSPVSVLEETESDEISPLHYNCIISTTTSSAKQYNFTTAAQGESSTSNIPQCKMKQPTKHYSTFQEFQPNAAPNTSSQYIINKRALLETKQLLIDCAKEVIQAHRKKDRILGTEELRKRVCENVWIWSQESIDETNIIHLVHDDFMATAEEWAANYEKQKMEISMKVGNAILEDVMKEL